MATVACELYHAFDDFDWVGFYRVTAPELLKIGPYQGGHGCLVDPASTAASAARPRASGGRRWWRTSTPSPATSPARRARARRSSCRCSTAPATLIAVLDVDSDTPAAFDAADAAALEGLVGEVFARRDLR